MSGQLKHKNKWIKQKVPDKRLKAVAVMAKARIKAKINLIYQV